eukprot:1327721-Rhodomonas_salina.2
MLQHQAGGDRRAAMRKKAEQARQAKAAEFTDSDDTDAEKPVVNARDPTVLPPALPCPFPLLPPSASAEQMS